MNTKNYIQKSLLLAFTGLIIPIIIYPLFHELGHVLSAIVLGVKVTEISFNPLENYSCVTEVTNGVKQIVIGFSGYLLPTAVSLIFKPKRFLLTYYCILFKIICIYSMILNVFYCLDFKNCFALKNDITTIIHTEPNVLPIILVFAPTYIFIAVRSIIKSDFILQLNKFYA